MLCDLWKKVTWSKIKSKVKWKDQETTQDILSYTNTKYL